MIRFVFGLFSEIVRTALWLAFNRPKVFAAFAGGGVAFLVFAWLIAGHHGGGSHAFTAAPQLPPPVNDKPDDLRSGGTGTAMALDEGKMGKKDSDRAEGQYKMKNNNVDPQVARQQAIEQARNAGIVGTAAATQGGEFASSTGTGGLSTDESKIYGSLTSPDALTAAVHAALATGDPSSLGKLMSASAFAFGPEASDRASSREATSALLKRRLGSSGGGFRVTAKSTHVGRDGTNAWIAEELEVAAPDSPPGSRPARFVMTIAAHDVRGNWEIEASHWAIALDNAVAFQRARDGKLAQPAAIDDDVHCDPSRSGLSAAACGAAADQLRVSARAAFGSRKAFVDAISDRADAFNFGSAPGERIVGGPAINRAFEKMDAEIKIHDGLKGATMGGDAGWVAANVDFSVTRGGTKITETYRVLAVLVRPDSCSADDCWRIVQTQWSNGM